jgi:alkylation response protein AidB-like acyl-CoA dehydrogenase
MDLQFTAEENAFREEVRTWLEENVPRGRKPESGPELREFDTAWQRKQYDGGWAGIAWPLEYGGRGFNLIRQLIWHEEYARAHAPNARSMFVALHHGGPTIIARGSEEQKAYHLPRILKGEAVWCQGFSEPGAGSDLAGIKTRGHIDGDHLVINGDKIWTSFAQFAQFQELVVRTDPAAQRHKGITWVICDMSLPGITINPITTLSGAKHFNQVFYDNVRIPLANVVGRINDGWSVAMATLSFERGTAMIEHQMELAHKVEELIALAKEATGFDGRPAIKDEAVAARLGTLRSEVAALRAMTYMAISRAAREPVPGPEGNMVALYFGELIKAVHQMYIELLGPRALERPTDGSKDNVKDYLETYRWTIAGGTSEIRRNVIGERVLGLPKK